MNSQQTVVINGFTVVPVKYNDQSLVSHYLYVKQHSVREADNSRPSNRTLFVLNIPPYVTEECLVTLFGEAGKVANVFIHKKPTSGAVDMPESEFFPNASSVGGYKVAYVVFHNEKSLKKALSLSYTAERYFSSSEHRLATGMSKWIKEHEMRVRPQEGKLKKDIDAYLQAYDEKQEKMKEDAKKAEGVADEDGWVKVTRHGRNKAVARTESLQKRVLAKEKHKKKQKELLNFYAFQIRETKREHIAKLREKFEEDKKRIEQLKQLRRFKPY